MREREREGGGGEGGKKGGMEGVIALSTVDAIPLASTIFQWRLSNMVRYFTLVVRFHEPNSHSDPYRY